MRYIFIIIYCCLLFSCSDSFINHDLKFEKVGECSKERGPIEMISNINGQRYKFDCCMDDDFNIKSYVVERKGDSIIVSFPKTAGKKQAEYNLTLDIDAKPGYKHIILDGQELTIVSSER